MNKTNAIRCDTDPDNASGDTAIIDYGRSAPLWVADLPVLEGSYRHACVATSVAFGEHLVLIDHNAIGNPAAVYDPVCSDVAHEQIGPVPPAVAARIAAATRPRCGRTNRHGRPCRVLVTAPGGTCSWHNRRREAAS